MVIRSVRRRARPNLEGLERRDVPATWGIPWPEAQHLTLSFAPDGTQVDGQSSQLFGKLDGQLGAGSWESTILGAFQAWAVNSNINVGEVADGGQPFGTAGPPQGDPRFGDIRVSAIPLPAGVAAITAPYDPATGTFSGDMILNSTTDFSSRTGLDLFEVALHEAGHTFGFGDSPNPSSFMYDDSASLPDSLGPAAISALQSLYGGPRNLLAQIPALYSGNSSRPVDLSAAFVASTGLAIPGDLNPSTPGNYFRFQAPTQAQAPLGLSFQVQTGGISQVIPRITITDASGKVVAGATATKTLDTLDVNLPAFVPNMKYQVRIDSTASGIQAAGSYILSAGPTKFSNSVSLTSNQAVALNTKAPTATTGLSTTSPIILSGQQDLYKFIAPLTPVAGLTVQLQANGLGLSAPQLVVYNSLGVAVGAATAADPSRTVVRVSLAAVSPGSTYYVKAITGTPNFYMPGMYQLAVGFGAPSGVSPSTAIIPTPWLGAWGASTNSPNTSPGAAASLVTPLGFASGSYYAAMAGIGTAGLSQYYSLKAPQQSRTGYMTLAIQGIGGSGLSPWVTVADQTGKALPTRILSDAGGVEVVQVAYTGSPAMILRVSSSANGGGSTGNYYLTATFGTIASTLTTLATGTNLSTTGPVPLTTVIPPSPTVYQFVLTGDAANTATGAILRATITDSSGRVVATLATKATEAISIALMLTDVSYNVSISATSPSGSAISGLKYTLAGIGLTDPAKVYSSTTAGGVRSQA